MENIKQDSKSGLIWITGYSSSGKTTISRILLPNLKERGFKVIFLDGDDLRGIFGDTWGFDKASRAELAQIYFRLCNHLISQKYLVIISAIAMFDGVSKWVKENVENSMQVFLNVPAELRIERDSKTKGIFTKRELNDEYYDYPSSADLKIDNYGDQTPEDSVKQILEFFHSMTNISADKGRDKHWQSYYSKSNVPDFPSTFALSVNQEIKSNLSILEIGCGNGRDSFYFSSEGHKVTAIDRSEAAIEACKASNSENSIEFINGTIDQYENKFSNLFDIIYSRFVIDAMPLGEEIDLLNRSYNLLKKNGSLFIECRSIKDRLAREGEFLSHTERVFGHYRRFIILEDFIKRLDKAGFVIEFVIENVIESKGLATFGDNDPVIIRVRACKKG